MGLTILIFAVWPALRRFFNIYLLSVKVKYIISNIMQQQTLMNETPVGANHIHNLKDILSTYNRITEACFARCVSNLGYKELTSLERECADNCGSKYINGNHRLMATFLGIQQTRQQAIIENAEQQQLNEQNQTVPNTQAVLPLSNDESEIDIDTNIPISNNDDSNKSTL